MSRVLPVAFITAGLIAIAAPAQAAKPQILLVELKAGADGEVTDIILAGRRIAPPKDSKRTRFEELTVRLRAMLELKPGVLRKEEFEIEIDAPDNLKYENIIQTISAVSAYLPEDGGEPRPLAKKVQFKSKGDARPDPNFELKLPKTP
jgi:hypothetical protein